MPSSRENSSPEWLIDTRAKLERFLAAVEHETWLAIDTEANPMHAYRERVCLIQVSTEDDDFILDPLSDVDLSPFLAKFGDPDIAKVFHDVEYDLIQLRRQFNIELCGLVDTRVLAVALGETAVGLASLVEKYLGVELDKRYQRSNWGARPLEPGQLDYARNDTRYLIPLAERLEARLEGCDALIHHEIDSEIRRLEELVVPERESLDPEGFLKLKGVRTLSPVQQRVLRQLWNWREQEAEDRDLPPFKIIGNAQLIAISQRLPSSRSELARVPGLPATIAQRHGSALQRVIEKAHAMPPYEITNHRPRRKGSARCASQAAMRPSHNSREDRNALDRLKRWRKERAELRPTDPSHILNREVMEELARLHPKPDTLRDLAATGLLERWRLAAYGREILSALRGSPS